MKLTEDVLKRLGFLQVVAGEWEPGVDLQKVSVAISLVKAEKHGWWIIFDFHIRPTTHPICTLEDLNHWWIALTGEPCGL